MAGLTPNLSFRWMVSVLWLTVRGDGVSLAREIALWPLKVCKVPDAILSARYSLCQRKTLPLTDMKQLGVKRSSCCSRNGLLL